MTVLTMYYDESLQKCVKHWTQNNQPAWLQMKGDRYQQKIRGMENVTSISAQIDKRTMIMNCK